MKATILIKAKVNGVPAQLALEVDELNWLPINAAARIEPNALPTQIFELQVATDRGTTGVQWSENLHTFVAIRERA